MLQIKTFEFNPLAENTYVVWDETGDGVVIDPGCYEQSEKEALFSFVEKENIKIKYLLNTHCHVDHVLGNYFVKQSYHVPFLTHAKEDAVLRAVKTYASNYGFFGYPEVLADAFLAIGFYHAESKQLFAGDVLFQRSIGRTDLPGGNFETLIDSIQKKIFMLPEAVIVYPGHGEPTTVGEEKLFNPFCALTQRA
jgi:hydroxyacylglutathione hydrolase